MLLSNSIEGAAAEVAISETLSYNENDDNDSNRSALYNNSSRSSEALNAVLHMLDLRIHLLSSLNRLPDVRQIRGKCFEFVPYLNL